jgi:hypothetical protein
MVGRFSLEGSREVGSQSGERRRGGASVTGRGSSSVGQSKGKLAALERLVVVASMSPEVGDGGSGPGGPSGLGSELAGEGVGRVMRRRTGQGGGSLGGPAG